MWFVVLAQLAIACGLEKLKTFEFTSSVKQSLGKSLLTLKQFTKPANLNFKRRYNYSSMAIVLLVTFFPPDRPINYLIFSMTRELVGLLIALR